MRDPASYRAARRKALRAKKLKWNADRYLATEHKRGSGDKEYPVYTYVHTSMEKKVAD